MKKKIRSCIFCGLLVCGIVLALTGCKPEKKPDDSVTAQKDPDDTTEDVVANTTDVKGPKVYANQTLAATITASERMVPGKVEQLWRDMLPELMTMGQGSYTGGKYWYQAYAQKDTESGELNNKCIIVKYDLATGEKIQVSEQYQLNHCNDITFNNKLGYLVVCHNSPVMNVISYINPETLELVETFAIDSFIYCISYNEKTDKYVVGLSGGQNFQILDSNFKPVSEIFQSTTKTKNYVTQGCTSDEDFIYFLLYEENVIAIYDWDGTFITVLDAGFVPTIAEPESLTVINGELYIGAMSKGHTDLRVYKISDFQPKQEETKQ